MNTEATRIALSIGERLNRCAVWAGDQCTWEIVRVEHADHGKYSRRELASGDLYQGSSGIALFLAELAEVVGERKFMATARAALRHALSLCTDGMMFGLYSGGLGPAYVSARLSVLTGEEEWREQARRIMALVPSKIGRDDRLDLIGGSAGAVLGTLRLCEMIDVPDAITIAEALGEHAVRNAQRRASGWSWGARETLAIQDLCGYAHGASGFVHAFLELFAATGDVRWQTAAASAMAYERRHLRENGDCADLRCWELGELRNRPGGWQRIRERAQAGDGPVWIDQPMRAWCHGAPGLLLPRLRAVQLGVDRDTSLAEAEQATRALLESVASIQSESSACLCHGAAGNLEMLLVAEREAGWRVPEDRWSAFLELAGHEEFVRQRWTSGTMGGNADPSLLVGESGIGHFLLRLTDHRVPSVLFLSNWRANSDLPSFDRGEWKRGEVRGLVPRLDALARRLPGGSVEVLLEGTVDPAPTVVEALRSARQTLEAAPANTELAMLADAVIGDVDRALLDNDFTDHLAVFYQRLAAPVHPLIALQTPRMKLRPDVRVVEHRWNWRKWDHDCESAPAEQPEFQILFQGERAVVAQEVTNVTALVFKALSKPSVLESVLAYVEEHSDLEEGGGADLLRAVLATLMRAARTGLVVLE